MITMKYGFVYQSLVVFIFFTCFNSCRTSFLKNAMRKESTANQNEYVSHNEIKEGSHMFESEDILTKTNEDESGNDFTRQEIEGRSWFVEETTNELIEQDIWFVAQENPVMPTSPFCAIDSELFQEAINNPPFLCNDQANVQEEENTRQVRAPFKPKPVIQYRDPSTEKKMTLIRPPTREEFDRGGHFYLGSDLEDRFEEPLNITEPEKNQLQACSCGKSTWYDTFRITKGFDVEPHMYPFLVSLQNTQGQHFCGGAIICSSYVVTAAHCLEGALPDQVFVRIGDHDISSHINGDESPMQQTVKVHSIITNFEYKQKSKDYDISLLRLANEILFNKHTGTVCLYKTSENEIPQDVHPLVARVAGWGVTQHGSKITTKIPKQAKVTTMSNDDCKKKSSYKEEQITDTMVCANGNGADACQGDSGGPLLWKDSILPRPKEYLIGVVSWGKGCGNTKYPGVYADVTKPDILKWIFENTRSCFYCQ